MAYERKPRATCVEKVGQRYELTQVGIAHAYEWGALGGGPKQIADYFNVDETTIRKWLDPDHDMYKPEFEDSYLEGKAEFNKRLLEAQQNLADTNAQMAIHLGKVHLGQKEDPQEHVHTHHVVGTLPDYEQTTADWLKAHAPAPLDGITARPGAGAIDAEFSSVEGIVEDTTEGTTEQVDAIEQGGN